MNEKKKLKVKPIFIYELFERKEKATWRNWAGIQTEEDVKQEQDRIKDEIGELESNADFPIEIMKLDSVKYHSGVPEWKPKRTDLDKIFYKLDSDLKECDALLIYGASGGRHQSEVLEALVSYNKPSILFLRYRSGPYYLPHEMISVWLRKWTDNKLYQGLDEEDIVVDDYNKVEKKLKSIYGVLNTKGSTVVSIGYPSGMDRLVFSAVYLAREKWDINVENIPYKYLEESIEEKRKDQEYMRKMEREAEDYLAQPHVNLKTDKDFIKGNFLLKNIFLELLEEHDSYSLTIGQCMSGIAPIADTTACLTIGLLNDSGYVGTCEADFVCVPANMLLRNISGKPTFLADPTWISDGEVSLAHCAGTAKMDGEEHDKVDVMTHYESDYGAAQRVHMEVGRNVTVVIPDFSAEEYIIFTGEVMKTPEKPMCRSHVDIKINGDWEKLNRAMRGFHWLICYGDYIEEMKYALSKVGIKTITI